MPISDLLLPEFDHEMKKTRITLECVPVDKPDFAPHAKSMPLRKLAPHVAQLAGFGTRFFQRQLQTVALRIGSPTARSFRRWRGQSSRRSASYA